MRDIAEQWLDWNRLGPMVAKYQAVIADDEVAATRRP